MLAGQRGLQRVEVGGVGAHDSDSSRGQVARARPRAGPRSPRSGTGRGRVPDPRRRRRRSRAGPGPPTPLRPAPSAQRRSSTDGRGLAARGWGARDPAGASDADGDADALARGRADGDAATRRATPGRPGPGAARGGRGTGSRSAASSGLACDRRPVGRDQRHLRGRDLVAQPGVRVRRRRRRRRRAGRAGLDRPARAPGQADGRGAQHQERPPLHLRNPRIPDRPIARTRPRVESRRTPQLPVPQQDPHNSMEERAMSASQAKALRSLAEPIVAGLDCDLEDVVIRQAGKRRLVRVVVDHRSGGLTLDLVASISREISRVLDDSTVLGNSPFVLEVTSPGVDRPLTPAAALEPRRRPPGAGHPHGRRADRGSGAQRGRVRGGPRRGRHRDDGRATPTWRARSCRWSSPGSRRSSSTRPDLDDDDDATTTRRTDPEEG